jgi:IS5 family transposase
LRENAQKSFTQAMKMYKIPSKQMTFEDFNQPIGMHMNPANRWVKKAELISWD